MMSRILASLLALAFSAGVAHAQAVGATEGVTTPASPHPGQAMPAQPPATLAHYPSRSAARTACGTGGVAWADDAKHLSDARHHPKGTGFYTCRTQALAAGYSAD